MAMPGDGIVTLRAWRIQVKKKLYWGSDFCAPIGDLQAQHSKSPTGLKDGTCSLPLSGTVPSAGSWGNANHAIPWVHYTLHPKTAKPCPLFHTVLFSPANPGKTKTRSPLLSSLSGQISTWQDNKKRKDRGNSLTSILLTLNISLQQTFL